MKGRTQRVGRWAAAFVVLVGATSFAAPSMAGQENICDEPSGSGDVVVGTENDDFLEGTDGDDTICGLGGDDVIDPGLGDDDVDGGDGSDTLWYLEFQHDPITVDLTTGEASGGEGNDEIVLGSIENVELNCSTENDDVLIGDDDDNTFSAGSGSDRVEGNGGDDLVYGTDPSWNRTDAVCWQFGGDEDSIDGGDGDDVLLGQESPDRLDGGPGWDVLDGGGSNDECLNGERYARCDVQDPPPPPPECSNGQDDDGDGEVDHPDDDGCDRAADPTEEPFDANCNDGVDNDDDGRVDFPKDFGCDALEDDGEFQICAGPCPPPTVTIEYRPRRGVFLGRAFNPINECSVDRLVALKHRRRGRSPRTVETTTTDDRTRWRIGGLAGSSGRFFAVARATTYRFSGGETVRCERVRSRTLRVGR